MDVTLSLQICSQNGNVLFPVWEYFIPNVGIIRSLNGNQWSMCLFSRIKVGILWWISRIIIEYIFRITILYTGINKDFSRNIYTIYCVFLQIVERRQASLCGALQKTTY